MHTTLSLSPMITAYDVTAPLSRPVLSSSDRYSCGVVRQSLSLESFRALSFFESSLYAGRAVEFVFLHYMLRVVMGGVYKLQQLDVVKLESLKLYINNDLEAFIGISYRYVLFIRN